MDIERFVTRAVLTVDEGESLQAAAVAMMERGVGSAVVMADGLPRGIVTDRDSLRVVAQGAEGKPLTVGDCLKRRLTTASPSMEVLEAARLMREKGFRHLVVVDEGGSLVGVFSMRDLVVGLLQELGTAADRATVGSAPDGE